MARKSLAALSVVTPLARKRPPPPAGLGESGNALWTDICKGFSHDHFSAADLPLLENYVRCVLLVSVCNEYLSDGILTNDGKAHPALAIRDAQLRNMASLATKLRLPVSSRIRSESKATRPGGLARPWETDPSNAKYFNDMFPGLD